MNTHVHTYTNVLHIFVLAGVVQLCACADFTFCIMRAGFCQLHHDNFVVRTRQASSQKNAPSNTNNIGVPARCCAHAERMLSPKHGAEKLHGKCTAYLSVPDDVYLDGHLVLAQPLHNQDVVHELMLFLEAQLHGLPHAQEPKLSSRTHLYTQKLVEKLVSTMAFSVLSEVFYTGSLDSLN